MLRLAVCTAAAAVALGGCSTAPRAATSTPTSRPTSAPVARHGARHVVVLGGLPLSAGDFAYSVVGSTVVAVARRVPPATAAQGAVTVVVFDPRRTRLVLHGGGAEPAPGIAWRYGPVVHGSERAALVAAFNGGFKVRDSHGGWMSQGRTVVPLVHGAASVVTYADGGTDVGAWGRDVPQPGRRVVSVRQNLQLLVDGGRARLTHPPDQHTLDVWWGHAFLEQHLISRSALGVTATGALVWAAGTDVSVGALARALIGAGAVRALELDINAPLVRGFLYAGVATVHKRARIVRTMLPLVAGQTQLRHDPGLTNPSVAPHCTYLQPCSRDFFTIVAR